MLDNLLGSFQVNFLQSCTSRHRPPFKKLKSSLYRALISRTLHYPEVVHSSANRMFQRLSYDQDTSLEARSEHPANDSVMSSLSSYTEAMHAST